MGVSAKELRGKEPIWCAGCGDFGVLKALQRAVADAELDPHETALVTGIGCSGNITAYLRTYGFHGIHGRALSAATGVKLANPELTVLVAGGDGDGYGMGLSHFIHTARRNVDLTYVVMDNQVYGLTKGQTSPTTDAGMSTKASPLGPMAQPVDPLVLAMAGDASFVAQGFSGDMKGLTGLIEQGIRHPGFAVINVQSPCVTYNQHNTYAWFNERLRDLAGEGHDPTDDEAAWAAARDPEGVPVGVLRRQVRPTLQEHVASGRSVGPGPVQAAADPAKAMAEQAETFRPWLATHTVG